jgi:hypothetical protein
MKMNEELNDEKVCGKIGEITKIQKKKSELKRVYE